MATVWSIGDIGTLAYVIKQELKENSVKIGKIKWSQRAAHQDNVDITAIFGVPLRNLPICKDPHTGLEVPRFVKECVDFLMRHLHEEGLFRKSGSITRQKEMQLKLNQGHSLPIDAQTPDVTSLFKQFLRELPEPLIPRQFQSALLKCVSAEDEILQEWTTLVVCCLLPPLPLQLIRYIMLFLTQVASNSENNRMDVKNLARVLVPNFMFSEKGDKKPCNVDKLLKCQTLVVETLINNAKDIGIVPEILLDRMMKAKSRSAETLDRLTSEDELEKTSDDNLDDVTRSRRKKRRSGTFHGIVNLGQRVGGLLKYSSSQDNLDDTPDEFHRETPRVMRSSKRKAIDDLGTAVSASKRKAILQQMTVNPQYSKPGLHINRSSPATPMTPLQPTKPPIGEVDPVDSEGRTLFHFDSPSIKFADDSFQGFSGCPAVTGVNSPAIPVGVTPRRNKLQKLNPLNSKKFKRLSLGAGLASGRPATPVKPPLRQSQIHPVESSPYINIGWRLAHHPPHRGQIQDDTTCHPPHRGPLQDNSALGSNRSARKSLRRRKHKKAPSSPATLFSDYPDMRKKNVDYLVAYNENAKVLLTNPEGVREYANNGQMCEDEKIKETQSAVRRADLCNDQTLRANVADRRENNVICPPPEDKASSSLDKPCLLETNIDVLPENVDDKDTKKESEVTSYHIDANNGSSNSSVPVEIQKGNLFCVTERICEDVLQEKGEREITSRGYGEDVRGDKDGCNKGDEIFESKEKNEECDAPKDGGIDSDVMNEGDQMNVSSRVDEFCGMIRKGGMNEEGKMMQYTEIDDTHESDEQKKLQRKKECKARERMISNVSQQSLSSVLSAVTVQSTKSNFTIEMAHERAEDVENDLSNEDDCMDMDIETDLNIVKLKSEIPVNVTNEIEMEVINVTPTNVCQGEVSDKKRLRSWGQSISLQSLDCTPSEDKTAEWILRKTVSLDSGKGNSLEDFGTCGEDGSPYSNTSETPVACTFDPDSTPTSSHFNFILKVDNPEEEAIESLPHGQIKKCNPSRLVPIKGDHTDSSLKSLHLMEQRHNLAHQRKESTSSIVQANIDLFNSMSNRERLLLPDDQRKSRVFRHNSGVYARSETGSKYEGLSPLLKSVSYDSGLHNLNDKTPTRVRTPRVCTPVPSRVRTPRACTPVPTLLDMNDSYEEAMRSAKKAITKFKRFHHSNRHQSFRRPLSDRNFQTPTNTTQTSRFNQDKHHVEPVLLQPLIPLHLASSPKIMTPVKRAVLVKHPSNSRLIRQSPVVASHRDYMRKKYKGTPNARVKKQYPSSPMDPLTSLRKSKNIKRQPIVTQQMKEEWKL